MEPTVRTAGAGDIRYIDALQRKNTEAVSFFPISAFEREVAKGRLLIAEVSGEPAGYVFHGPFGPMLRIHQACIQYDLRGQLFGAALVRYLIDTAERCGSMSIVLRCGSDIEANFFWQAMGFHCEAVQPGGARRSRDINCWRYDLDAPLFVTTIEASNRTQDSRMWHQNGKLNRSQFLRGRRARLNRRLIEHARN